MGIFSAIASFAIPIVTSILGASQSRKADAKASDRQVENSFANFQAQWDYKRQQGLTPWELSGASTSNAPPTSNTLGSNQAIQRAGQQIQEIKFKREQNALDRQNRLEVSQIQAQAPLQQAGTAQQSFQLKQKLQPHEIQKIKAQTKQLLAQSKLTQKQVDTYWPTIFAKMGPENVMAALAAFNSGLSLERVLTASGNITQEEREATNQLYNKLLTARSLLGKQVLTAKEIIQNVINFAKSESNKLGNNSPKKPRIPFFIESNKSVKQ